MHICHEEIFAFMQAIPGLKLVVPYIKLKWHEWKGCNEKHKTENDTMATDQIRPNEGNKK